jgi:hypothetical protein
VGWEFRIPRFFVALAHTDCFAYIAEGSGSRKKISLTRIFPDSLRTNLLFSLSFDPAIHYETGLSLNPSDPETLGPSPAKFLFADCGAFQYRVMEVPQFADGTIVTAASAWKRYRGLHLGPTRHWEEILLCSPDHIVLPEHDEEEEERRVEYTLGQAKDFIELSRGDNRVTAVGVLHGNNLNQRKKMLEEYIQMGYEYVALGGMVPRSTKTKEVLNIVAGISSIDDPEIARDSILYRCRDKGLKLHILGLNSPEWWRWWIRLEIDSFDGSKLSTEGAANGWYWLPRDGSAPGREPQERPLNAIQLYTKIKVRDIDPQSWNWSNDSGLMRPIERTGVRNLDTTCNCPACNILSSWPCASSRCWMHKKHDETTHASDPRMMGSTEHNMGRVGHNAHVLEWIVKEILRLNKLAESNDESWLRNWKRVRVEE